MENGLWQVVHMMTMIQRMNPIVTRIAVGMIACASVIIALLSERMITMLPRSAMIAVMLDNESAVAIQDFGHNNHLKIAADKVSLSAASFLGELY